MSCTKELCISPDEVSFELRDSIDLNNPNAMAWVSKMLEKAERRLFALCPAARWKVSRGDAQAIAIAKDLVIEAVARVARVEPESVGYRSETEDGYSYTVDPLTRAGNIWFPDSDLAQLGCGPKVAGGVPRSARLARGTGWHGGLR